MRGNRQVSILGPYSGQAKQHKELNPSEKDRNSSVSIPAQFLKTRAVLKRAAGFGVQALFENLIVGDPA